MAIGQASDFVIYQDQMRGAIVERLTQASSFFNGAGRGIVLSTVSRRGDYAQESFFQNIANAVTRRDTTSTGTVTDLALAMEELISVKVNRKVGPVAQTLDAFRKVQMNANSESLSFLIGTQFAKGMEIEMLNTILGVGRAALAAQASAFFDYSATGTIVTENLVDGLAKFGDASSRIGVWVMHSKVYFDLLKSQIDPTNQGDVVAGAQLASASPATLNRPVIVTDSDSLIVTGAPDTYYTLGLTENALVAESSEQEDMVSELVTGLENLVVRLQGEYAYNVGMKGFAYDIAAGGANPDATAITTAANWDPKMASVKDWAGVCIATQ
jgi:hypothetical protein